MARSLIDEAFCIPVYYLDPQTCLAIVSKTGAAPSVKQQAELFNTKVLKRSDSNCEPGKAEEECLHPEHRAHRCGHL